MTVRYDEMDNAGKIDDNAKRLAELSRNWRELTISKWQVISELSETILRLKNIIHTTTK